MRRKHIHYLFRIRYSVQPKFRNRVFALISLLSLHHSFHSFRFLFFFVASPLLMFILWDLSLLSFDFVVPYHTMKFDIVKNLNGCNLCRKIVCDLSIIRSKYDLMVHVCSIRSFFSSFWISNNTAMPLDCSSHAQWHNSWTLWDFITFSLCCSWCRRAQLHVFQYQKHFG